MHIVAGVFAGVVGTAAFSMVMALAPRMGMPKMAIWEMLGSMFNPQGNIALGWAAHFMMGVIFAIVYTALWSAGVGSASVSVGALFGLVHWLIVGIMMGAMPMMHAGIQVGAVEAPGVYMIKNDGLMGFVGGTIGHIVFGIVVALAYSAVAG